MEDDAGGVDHPLLARPGERPGPLDDPRAARSASASARGRRIGRQRGALGGQDRPRGLDHERARGGGGGVPRVRPGRVRRAARRREGAKAHVVHRQQNSRPRAAGQPRMRAMTARKPVQAARSAARPPRPGTPARPCRRSWASSPARRSPWSAPLTTSKRTLGSAARGRTPAPVRPRVQRRRAVVRRHARRVRTGTARLGPARRLACAVDLLAQEVLGRGDRPRGRAGAPPGAGGGSGRLEGVRDRRDLVGPALHPPQARTRPRPDRNAKRRGSRGTAPSRAASAVRSSGRPSRSA